MLFLVQSEVSVVEVQKRIEEFVADIPEKVGILSTSGSGFPEFPECNS